MNIKIILLTSMFVALKSMEIEALKRIKRNPDLKTHNDRITQDFVKLHGEKQGPIATLKNNNPITAYYDTVLNSDAKYNISQNSVSDTERTHNRSIPFVMILRQNQHKLKERQLQDPNQAEGVTASVDSKNLENNASKSETSMDRRYDFNGKFKEPFSYHKTKHLTHSLHSKDLVEAKVVYPSQHVQSDYRGLSSLASIQQLMKLGNMMMFKIGMGALPYTAQYPKTYITQNSPEKENLHQASNEPAFDNIFNSIEGPQENYFSPKTIQLTNSPFIQNGGSAAHSIIYKPSVSVKEPTQLSTLMQTALDTLMGNDDAVDGDDKYKNEIEFTCPIHHAKKSAQNLADNADIIQVCSCRYIKKPKE